MMAPMLTKLVAVLSTALIFTPAALAAEHKIVVSPVGSGFAIVTDIDNGQPFVGQQISIIYSLRALRSPSSIDIDPQQFSGFWTEIAPISENSTPAAKLLDGKLALDFVLRQVIAFPLSNGVLALPPLRLKMKLNRADSAPAEEWDLICSSEPVQLSVKPVPNGKSNSIPMVGVLEGNYMPASNSAGRDVLLELRGSANFAFLDPQSWLAHPEIFSITPVDREKMVQIQDLSSARKVSVSQRCFWRIHVLDHTLTRMPDLAIPFFQPEQGSWQEAKIPGIELAAAKPVSTALDLIDRAENPKTKFPWLLIPLGLAASALFVCGRRFFQKRKERAEKNWLSKGLASLVGLPESSSKPFLDTAHKMLERHALEMGSGELGSGNTSADHYWNEVERLRFGSGRISVELRKEIMQYFESRAAQKITNAGNTEKTEKNTGYTE
jgi:hypothetical protein